MDRNTTTINMKTTATVAAGAVCLFPTKAKNRK